MVQLYMEKSWADWDNMFNYIEPKPQCFSNLERPAFCCLKANHRRVGILP